MAIVASGISEGGIAETMFCPMACAVDSSVNWVNLTNFFLSKTFFFGNLIEFPTANITQISPLGQKKNSKSPSLNPTHLVFPTIPRAHPIFSYYFYILFK